MALDLPRNAASQVVRAFARARSISSTWSGMRARAYAKWTSHDADHHHHHHHHFGAISHIASAQPPSKSTPYFSLTERYLHQADVKDIGDVVAVRERASERAREYWTPTDNETKAGAWMTKYGLDWAGALLSTDRKLVQFGLSPFGVRLVKRAQARALYLNKRLRHLDADIDTKCPICKTADESLEHVVLECAGLVSARGW